MKCPYQSHKGTCLAKFYECYSGIGTEGAKGIIIHRTTPHDRALLEKFSTFNPYFYVLSLFMNGNRKPHPKLIPYILEDVPI
jgi:hypothetical protein